MIKINSESVLVDYIKTLLKTKYDADFHTSYYDAETHRYLGEYLRELRDKDHINLMAMYNLFDGKLINDYRLKLTQNGLELYKIGVTDLQFDLIAIPIKPDQTYTLFFDTENKYPIYVAGVVFDGDSFISTTCMNPMTTYKEISTFSNKIGDADNLWMIVQVPVECNTRVVVEGDYTDNPERVITAWRYKKEDGAEVETTFDEYAHYTVRLKDFATNDNSPVAITDELVAYLLNYCITPKSDENNILLLQRLVTSDRLYTRVGAKFNKELITGTYDETLRKWLYDFSKNFVGKDNALGLVDKDTEQLLFKGVLDE